MNCDNVLNVEGVSINFGSTVAKQWLCTRSEGRTWCHAFKASSLLLGSPEIAYTFTHVLYTRYAIHSPISVEW